MALAQVPAIQALVALGCQVSVQDSVSSTPLHVAAGEGHLAAVIELCRLVSSLPCPCGEERLRLCAGRFVFCSPLLPCMDWRPAQNAAPIASVRPKKPEGQLNASSSSW